jgi:hypothetical protein
MMEEQEKCGTLASIVASVEPGFHQKETPTLAIHWLRPWSLTA